MELKDFLYVGEYIKDRLYFATIPNGCMPQSSRKYYFFNIDNELIYENFYFDFGPLNLSMLYRYCIKVSKLLATYDDKIIVHCTTLTAEKRSNAAFLIACFAIVHLNKSVEEALRPLIGKNIPPLIPFRDAASIICMFNVSVKDCLQAVYRAKALGFFRFNDFNAAEYEHYEKVSEGDMNWIVPQKFLAFSGPHSHVDTVNSQEHAPEYYFSYFKNNNVTNVIRLNKKAYDANRFIDSGFQHNDLYFIDGSTPSNLILDKFFNITENAKGAIAVHCKAGLGRTGSVIACYLMKHYRFNVGEAIAWVRICRPGSIIGVQQTWLNKKKPQLWLEGNRYRQKLYGNANFIPTHRFGIYSKEIHKMGNGAFENWQADLLYEPTIMNKSDGLSKVMRDIGAIKLNEKEEPPYRTRSCVKEAANYEKKNADSTSGVIRTSHSRPNGTQGDHLCQIKASRKQNRSLSTPISPLTATKARLIEPKPKLVPVTKIYRIPIEVSPKSSTCVTSNFYSQFSMNSNVAPMKSHYRRRGTNSGQ